MTIRQPVFVVVEAGALVGIGLWMIHRARPTPSPPVRVPELSAAARAGQLAYQRRLCVVSRRSRPGHTERAAAPISRPGHRAAVAFGLAVRRGKSGPTTGDSGTCRRSRLRWPAEVAEVTRFMRERQQADGID
jgi:hypothetical protein